MKTAKRILTVALALMLIFALAAPSFAVNYGDSASYQQVALANAPTITGQFTVYLSIDSYNYRYGTNGTNYKIEREKLPVTMGADGVTATYTVLDALLAARAQYSSLYFYENSSNSVLSSSSTTVVGIKDTSIGSSHTFSTKLSIHSGSNGWMFRIDGKYPILNQADWPSGWTAAKGPCGAKIHQAYLTGNGQLINFYFADTYDAAYATKTTCFNNISYNSSTSTLSLQVLVSDSWYDTAANNYYWHINDYDIWENSAIYIYVDGTGYSSTTDSSGNASFSINSLSPGQHTIKVQKAFLTYQVGSYYYSFLYMTPMESYSITV